MPLRVSVKIASLHNEVRVVHGGLVCGVVTVLMVTTDCDGRLMHVKMRWQHLLVCLARKHSQTLVHCNSIWRTNDECLERQVDDSLWYLHVGQKTWLPRNNFRYRFSAYWLRSKCSICSYQLNIWYVPYMGTSILNWFLNLGEELGACSTFATGWPGIAVPPGTAHK